MTPGILPGAGARRAIFALGGVYAVISAVWPFVRIAGHTTLRESLIVSTLVGGAGIALLYGGYRLPRSEIRPRFFATVASWCFRAAVVMVGILVFIALVSDLNDPAANFLILPALAAVAGLVGGIHDARAKTRAAVLEQRNRELQQTQVQLEETIERLEESERRYRTVTENFPNGAVGLLNEELRHTLVAGKGFEKLDFGASDLRGERVEDIYAGEALDVIESNYRTTLDGEPTTFELELQGRTFEFRTHPLTDDDDTAYALLAISQDITERKQRERELAKRARQQRVIADLGQLALETDDLDELVREASRQVADVLDNEFCKVLELDERNEEFRLREGVGWDDGFAGETTVSAVETDSQAAYTLARDHPIAVENLEAETRFGGSELLASHDVRSGISTRIGPADEPWGILGTHDTESWTFTEEDVTFVQTVANVLAAAIERQQYQEDLEQLVADLEESNERLEQFAYAASHDLQEPLRMVSTYLQLIERRYGGEFNGEAEEFFEYAVDGAERMRSMIDGLLQYSRVETQADEFEPVDLEGVLDDVREDLRMKIEGTGTDIAAESLPRVEGDEGQLRQVFQNLLSNAIKFSGAESPRVDVSAERDGGAWIVSVADDGIGIDPDDQERIFEVFEGFHGDGDYAGTGIGLALCERIVERHGGEIWVDSRPGEGATFSFTLPAVEADSVDSTAVRGPDGYPSGE